MLTFHKDHWIVLQLLCNIANTQQTMSGRNKQFCFFPVFFRKKLFKEVKRHLSMLTLCEEGWVRMQETSKSFAAAGAKLKASFSF